MFGIKKNVTWTFFTKVGNWSQDFVFGMVEEVSLNATSVPAANAMELPEKVTNEIVRTTSLTLTSKVLNLDVFSLILGATPNLII